MGKQIRMETQAGEPDGKWLRDLRSSEEDGMLLAHSKYLSLKEIIFPLKVTFSADSFSKQCGETDLCLLFPDRR